MTAGGMHVEGPGVCPFVALESDRDRRMDEPDHRHRCYAVPTPEPRAIAHQEAYCLSPGFTLCPIFQDWAKRAAASPIVTAPVAGAAGSDAVGEPEQLGVFDGPAAPLAPVAPASAPGEPASQYARPHVPPPEPPPVSPPQAARPTQIERIPSTTEPPYPAGPAPLPAFLASRERPAAPPPPAPLGPADHSPSVADVPVERVRSNARDERAAQREALVPAWDREEQFNPPRAGRGRIGRGEGSDIVGRMTTILAVLALLSLALLLLVFAPGFLGGSPESSAPVGGATATPARTAPPATATPLPAATPQTYTIQPGDSMFGIAARFGLTVEQLQAANPQITNPNLIQVGQVIVIPSPDSVPPPS